MARNKYDFSGWATKNNLKCSDGRTIMPGAFQDCDGMVVPLVWNHQHNESNNVLGHALLENRSDGVYAYCSFNDTESGQNAKMLVQHGDIKALSIYANKLKHQGHNVIHGMIREVSLVLAGANPGALIDSFSVAHSDDSDLDADAIIYTGEELVHSCEGPDKDDEKPEPKEENPEDTDEKEEGSEDDEKADDPKESEEEEKKEDMKDNMQHADGEEKTVQEVFDSMSEEQKTVCYALIGQAIEDAKKDSEGGEEMKHNVFESNDVEDDVLVLNAENMQSIMHSAERLGSLKKAMSQFAEDNDCDFDTLAHSVEDANGNTVTYGMANIDYLYPDYRNIDGSNIPFIKKDDAWVAAVMNGVHHTPFSRVKSLFADITMDEARAKGYIKGNEKADEVFSLLKRTTDPATVYKKNKLDRDDILDITDFDAIVFLKQEMRIQLNYECARAILIGDGRLAADPDHIDPNRIRPIWTDSTDLFVLSKVVEYEAADTDFDKVNKVIDAAIEGQEDYTGSGHLTMFCKKRFLTKAKLERNSIGERLYKNTQELADELGVDKIVPVAEFNNKTRTVSGVTRTLEAIVVDMNDYNVGTNKGGEINFFDDFDINFNQNIYLMETRFSGALIRPKSAIVIESVLGE